EADADEVDPRASEGRIAYAASGKGKTGQRTTKDTRGLGRNILGLQGLGSVLALCGSLPYAGGKPLLMRRITIATGEKDADAADQGNWRLKDRITNCLIKWNSARQRANTAALCLQHQARLHPVRFGCRYISLRQVRGRNIEAVR